MVIFHHPSWWASQTADVTFTNSILWSVHSILWLRLYQIKMLPSPRNLVHTYLPNYLVVVTKGASGLESDSAQPLWPISERCRHQSALCTDSPLRNATVAAVNKWHGSVAAYDRSRNSVQYFTEEQWQYCTTYVKSAFARLKGKFRCLATCAFRCFGLHAVPKIGLISPISEWARYT